MIRILISLLTVATLSGCVKDEPTPPENYLEEYQISMDHIEVPDQVAPDQPLVVKLHGIVGPNSAYSFDHADTVQSVSVYELKLFGVQDTNPDMSHLQVLIEWRGREFVKQPPHVDQVRVVVHQPDGTILKQIVPVVP